MQEAKFQVINVEKEDFDLYKLVEDDKSISLSHGEAFLLAACIGYKYNLREKINKREQLTRVTALLNIDYAQTVFDAFKYLASANHEIDEDGNVIVNTIMEEYAKGGFRKLYNEILNKTGKMSNNLLNYLMLNIG